VRIIYHLLNEFTFEDVGTTHDVPCGASFYEPEAAGFACIIYHYAFTLPCRRSDALANQSIHEAGECGPKPTDIRSLPTRFTTTDTSNLPEKNEEFHRECFKVCAVPRFDELSVN
jgi:hypothetical protein